jgi:hypothetical protein
MNADLTELMALDRTALVMRWEQEFGHPAPAKSRVDLLRQALAWQLQAKQTGGFSSAEKRNLRDGEPPSLAVGSRLIRVWRGETHQVTVLKDGFVYAGKNWKSLTAIAKAITGTAWSGPVFFGVKK